MAWLYCCFILGKTDVNSAKGQTATSNQVHYSLQYKVAMQPMKEITIMSTYLHLCMPAIAYLQAGQVKHFRIITYFSYFYHLFSPKDSFFQAPPSWRESSSTERGCSTKQKAELQTEAQNPLYFIADCSKCRWILGVGGWWLTTGRWSTSLILPASTVSPKLIQSFCSFQNGDQLGHAKFYHCWIFQKGI